jgi:hypothetical protein
MWEPRRLTALWASTAFTIFLFSQEKWKHERTEEFLNLHSSCDIIRVTESNDTGLRVNVTQIGYGIMFDKPEDKIPFGNIRHSRKNSTKIRRGKT